MKKTKWFVGGANPTIPGVYETSSENGSYQHWNGESWGFCASTPKAASLKANGARSRYQDPAWRGLASDPSKGA